MNKSNSILRQDLERAVNNYIKEFARIMETDMRDTYSVANDVMNTLCLGDIQFWNITDVIDVVDYYNDSTLLVPTTEHEEIREQICKSAREWYNTAYKWYKLQMEHQELRDVNFINITSWLKGAPKELWTDKIKEYDTGRI